MTTVVVFMCLLVVGCLAQKPHRCTSPPLLTGALTVSTQNEKFWAYAKYIYDAIGQRIRLGEMGTYENKTFTLDVLLLYREGVMYQIDEPKRHCRKEALKTDFHPFEIPKDATLLGQVILGSSSGPGQGLLVNTWTGELQLNETVKYMNTVTEFGCIPVSTMYHTKDYGWVLTSFFNNVIGISDPGLLNPPDFCQGVEMKSANGVKTADFYSLFINKH